MSGKTIYIVVGECGEYDDQREWLVVSYRDEARANTHARNANAESHRIETAIAELDQEDWEHYRAQRDALCASNTFDPAMQDDYPRAGYDVRALELL